MELLFGTIEAFSSRLEGILTRGGRTFSFPYASPGDSIFEIPGTKRKKIERSKPWSVPCPQFGECGGCLAQHIPYESQWDLLVNPLKLELSPDLVWEEVAGEFLYAYRQRMDFATFPGKLGLRKRGNFKVLVDIPKCFIQSNDIQAEWERVRFVLNRYPELPWDRKRDSGGLKYVTLRSNVSGNDGFLALTFSDGFPIPNAFLEELLIDCKFENLVLFFNKKESEVSSQGKMQILRGKGGFTEDFFGPSIFIPGGSFFQPNPRGFLPILKFAKEVIGEARSKNQILVDLFCGTGLFGLVLGDVFSEIHLVELDKESLALAEERIRRTFLEKKVKAQVIDLHSKPEAWEFPSDSFVVVDPPRKGLGDALVEKLLEAKPKDLLYVSCNPESQWQDFLKLSQGFRWKKGLVTDPYPHTPHLESVIWLESL